MIVPVNSHTNIAGNPYTIAQSPDRKGERASVQEDSFRFSPTDLTPEGNLKLIVQTSDQQLLARLMHECVDCGKVTGLLSLISGFSAEISPAAYQNIFSKVSDRVSVTLDGEVLVPKPEELASNNGESSQPAKLDVALPTLGVDKLHQKGIKGKGITWAVIDTGINASHPDLEGQVIGWKDFIEATDSPVDPQGHGTHVGSTIDGTGKASDGKFVGVAPEAKLVGVRVLDADGSGSFSDVIKGIQWVVEHKDEFGIRGFNMSLGGTSFSSYKNDPVAQAVEKAVAAGLVAEIAAGNSGPSQGTVSTPGIAPSAETIGALDDKGTVDRSDDGVARFSGTGPTKVDKLQKPDLLFPGVKITAALSPGSALDSPDIPHVGDKYITISGTSMATPYGSGVSILMLSVNPDLTPQQVKEIKTRTAEKLADVDVTRQGFGVGMPEKAVAEAEALLPPAPPAPEPPVEPQPPPPPPSQGEPGEPPEWLVAA